MEKGPFIVITGHDLYDLKQLLEQTKDKGINIYTHSEMLPAHGYPELKKYPHLKGNFGTAWQNQQKEFDSIPAPILFTTNCLMPPKKSYSDRVFTTEAVSYPEMVHIGQDKDFTPVIEKALELGGYTTDMHFTGINGGSKVMTGFAHWDAQMPVTRSTGAVILLSDSFGRRNREEPSCIRCGKCADACPMQLLPLYIARYAAAGKYDKAIRMGALNCGECGSCTYACPAGVEITQLIRTVKQNAEREG